LVPGTLEFAIHTLVERRMDMSVFDDNYQNDDTGRSAYETKWGRPFYLYIYMMSVI